MTQLLLDGFTPAKPKKRQAPVILARRKTTCGFRCGHDIRIGDPITVLSNGRWVHVYDVNDAEIAKRADILVGEALLEKTGSRLVDEPIPDSVWDVNGAGLIDTEGCDITPSDPRRIEEEGVSSGAIEMEFERLSSAAPEGTTSEEIWRQAVKNVEHMQEEMLSVYMADAYPEEALEETAEWQRAHLPPEERWHPDLVAAN
tara:strand:+ start:767 stop:1369 length:603 start_codon:yes stop_codon:yes gene_type:complete